MTITARHFPSRQEPSGGASPAPGYRYVEVIQPGREDLEWVARNFSLDVSEIEQLHDPDLKPELVEYPDHLLVRFNIPRLRGANRLSWERVDLILSSSLLIAVQQRPLPLLHRIQQNSESGREPDGPTRFMAQILLSTVETFHEVANELEEMLRLLSEQPSSAAAMRGKEIAEIQKQLNELHHGVDEFQDVLWDLGDLHDRIDPAVAADIRAAHDRLIAIADEMNKSGRHATEEYAGESLEPRAMGADRRRSWPRPPRSASAGSSALP
jgi:Mg2+ and Co2+ transporter CorA